MLSVIHTLNLSTVDFQLTSTQRAWRCRINVKWTLLTRTQVSSLKQLAKLLAVLPVAWQCLLTEGLLYLAIVTHALKSTAERLGPWELRQQTWAHLLANHEERPIKYWSRFYEVLRNRIRFWMYYGFLLLGHLFCSLGSLNHNFVASSFSALRKSG